MDKLYENSETGCCPRFNPEPWDGKEVTFHDKLFLKEHIRTFLHIPLGFGKVMVRTTEKIKAAKRAEFERGARALGVSEWKIFDFNESPLIVGLPEYIQLVNVIREFLIPETVADIVPADVDFVIDCIDSLNCKVALVATSVERGLKVASSMGAGNKLDPTRIRIADISKTEMCPLASVMRKRLRKRGIPKGVLTVFSDEPGRAPLPPQPVEGRGRDRAVNGTISYMPPLFGLMLAGAVVQKLIAEG